MRSSKSWLRTWPAESLGDFKSQPEFETAKSTVIRLLEPSPLPQDKLLEEFYYGFTEERMAARRKECFKVTEKDVADVIERYVLANIREDKSSKVIFGTKDNNLEGFVSRGWEVEKYFQEISLNVDRYNASMDLWSEKIKKYH